MPWDPARGPERTPDPPQTDSLRPASRAISRESSQLAQYFCFGRGERHHTQPRLTQQGNVTQRRPSDQVDQDKRVHLSRAARHYLAGLGNPPLAYRFDVVELVYHGWRVVEARHWPAEFPEVVAPHARWGD